SSGRRDLRDAARWRQHARYDRSDSDYHQRRRRISRTSEVIMRFRLTCLFTVMGALASAQPGGVAGPSAGYVFAPDAKTVRQVRGIPGAAMLGDPVDFGMPITRAEISARGDFAATIAADGMLHLFRLANGTAKEVKADHAMTAADRIVFSPSGTA